MSKKIAISILIGVFVVLAMLGMAFLCFKLIYSTKYKQEVKKYSQQTEISESLIYAVIKAESGFNKNAVSKAGAKGLMQLKLETANYVCELYNFDFLESENDLFNAETNIKLGTYYLKYLLNKFDNNLKYALVAYNAGEGKVKEWMLSDNFDSVAYSVSLNYYKKVLKYQKTYQKIIKS